MEKINVAELLKDCPEGMELDCTIYENTYFGGLTEDESDEYPIIVNICNDRCEHNMYLTKEGCWTSHSEAKCVIFPKGKTTWKGFRRPFKDGDVITCTNSCCTFTSIFKEGPIEKSFIRHCILILDDNEFKVGCSLSDFYNPRFATEEEKEKLFKAIKKHGCKWNAETKTLEKLVEPKFKVGDRIILKDNPHNIPSIRIKAVTKSQYILENESFLYIDSTDEKYVLEDRFDINTLVPFESRVLVRHNRDNKWCGSFFSHIDNDFHSHCYKFVTTSGKSYPMCIPYEGNEHLIGKTEDCDEYFKTWK